MNKLCNFMVLFMALSGNVFAQKTEPWNDPLVNNINRNEPVSDFFGYENKELSDRNDKTLSKRFLSIEGNWKFNWVQNANERPLDFYSLNLDDSNWGKMPIPGCWELNGYGVPVYTNINMSGKMNGNQILLMCRILATMSDLTDVRL